MDESWLYYKLGEKALSEKQSTLVILKDTRGLNEAYSKGFISHLHPTTVYFTLARSAEKISIPMNAGNMLWIDASGAPVGIVPDFQVTRVPSLKNLVSLSALFGTIASGGNHSFIVINSLNELLASVGAEKASAFVNFLVRRMDYAGTGSLFFVLENEKTAAFILQISPFFDKILRV